MSLTEDTGQLERDQRRYAKIGKICCGGLVGAVSRNGGELQGFSVRYGGFDCLITLRAEFPGGRQVCFIGAADLGLALIRAWDAANKDELRWKVDQYARG